MSDLSLTHLWFKRAIPQPTEKNQQVQLGCHFEEVAEMGRALVGDDDKSAALLATAVEAIHNLAEALKKGEAKVVVADRKELLDACADQIVTAVGVGHMNKMDVPQGLTRVNESNFSKFDKDGMPIFDANGKIAKAAGFFRPDFTGLY